MGVHTHVDGALVTRKGRDESREEGERGRGGRHFPTNVPSADVKQLTGRVERYGEALVPKADLKVSAFVGRDPILFILDTHHVFFER